MTKQLQLFCHSEMTDPSTGPLPTLTAVLGHQGTNNKLIKHFSNYKYINTISYGADMLLVDVWKCLYVIFHPQPD